MQFMHASTNEGSTGLQSKTLTENRLAPLLGRASICGKASRQAVSIIICFTNILISMDGLHKSKGRHIGQSCMHFPYIVLVIIKRSAPIPALHAYHSLRDSWFVMDSISCNPLHLTEDIANDLRIIRNPSRFLRGLHFHFWLDPFAVAYI